MLCARVMRGISSMENRLTWRSAMRRDGIERGERLAEADDGLRRRAEQFDIAAAGLGIGAGRAHLQQDFGLGENLGAALADARAFLGILGIGKAGAQPAPDSTSRSTPLFLKAAMTLGTIATRRSPGQDSTTTPTGIAKVSLQEKMP